MPPQSNPAPSSPQTPPQPYNPNPVPVSPINNLQKNPKFLITIKTIAIYGTLAWLISAIAGIILSSFSFSAYYNPFSVGSLISALISGIIGSVIAGAVFYFIYDPIHNWVKGNSFLSKYIHNMFTLFWKPYLVGIIISGILCLLGLFSLSAIAVGAFGPVGFGGLFIGWIISFVVNVAVYYWYAKTVSAKLESYYPW